MPDSHTVLISAVALSKSGFDQLRQKVVVSAETSKFRLAVALSNRMENWRFLQRSDQLWIHVRDLDHSYYTIGCCTQYGQHFWCILWKLHLRGFCSFFLFFFDFLGFVFFLFSSSSSLLPLPLLPLLPLPLLFFLSSPPSSSSSSSSLLFFLAFSSLLLSSVTAHEASGSGSSGYQIGMASLFPIGSYL